MSAPPAMPTNVVRPAAWTMASVNARRLNDLCRRIAEAEARSMALTAKIPGLITIDADPCEDERQLWDVLDALSRMRLERWTLSQKK